MTLIGRIRLSLTVGDSDRQATILVDFLIINCPSAYNIVMGRPTMNDLNLVILTKALAIKFLTLNRTGCIRGEQYSARHCYKEALKNGFKEKKVNVVFRGRKSMLSLEKGHEL